MGKEKATKNSLFIFFTAICLPILIIYFLGIRQKASLEENYRQLEKEFLKEYSDNIPKDWVIVDLDGFGRISIPPTLEIREEDSSLDLINKSAKNLVYKLMGEEEGDLIIVFQQKGLNDDNRDAYKSYARVMITIFDLEDDTVSKRWEALRFYELAILKQASLYTLTEASESFDCKFKDTDFRERTINHMNSTEFTFTRSCRGNPEIYVEQYKFNNFNERVEVILSYRVNEKERWEKDFQKIIETFIITN